jgi:hypothetical protein
MSTYLEFILGFLFNLLFALVVVRFIYYPMTHNKPYVFTFLAFNTVIYFVLSFIYSLEISVGVGFGLFAIFSILRYRTDPIPIREMTYMFVIAALPVMNSAGVKAGIWIELLIANIAIALILFVLEKEWGFHFEASKRITYERIDLIKPENYQLLINDLQERTGLTIKSAVVGKINFLRDTAEVKIIYENGHENTWLHTMEREVVYTTTSSDDD